MASGDATYLPIKNTAYRAYFPILDADGDPVPGASGLDSEISIDGASMADCTNEATYIADSAGGYYLDFVASEMNSSCSFAEIKSSAPGKTTELTMYPVEEGDYGTATQTKLASVITNIAALNDITATAVTDIMDANSTQLATIISDYAQASAVAAVDTKVTDVAQASAVVAVDTKVTDVAQASAVAAIVDYAQASTLTTVDGKVTDVAQASAVASIPTESIATVVAAVWDKALTGATHNVATSAGKRLRQIDAAFEVASGTAQAGAATSITLASTESSVSNIFDGDRVIIVGGTGQREHNIITVYNGSTKVATTSKTWTITPDNTSEYEILPANVDLQTWDHNVVTGDGGWLELQSDVDIIVANNAQASAVAALNDISAGDVTLDIDANSTQLAAILTSTAAMEASYAQASAVAALNDITATAIMDVMDAGSTQLAAILGYTAAMDASYAQASALLTAAVVKTQVASALSSDTYAESGAGTATTTASISTKLSYLHQVLINKNTSTSVLASIYAADGSTTVMTSTVSSDGTTYTKGRFS